MRRRLLRISVRVLLLSAIVLPAGFFLSRAVRDARIAAQRMQCNCHLCCLGISLHEYHEKYGHFPPAYTVDSNGNRLHSWRVLLLEFIDRPLFAEVRLDEPWNSPTNSKLAGRMPRTYSCPCDLEAEQRGWTSYVVVVGDATAFPHSKTVSLDDVKDDRASTILIAEHSDSGIPWMEPRDLEIDTMSFALDDPAGICSRHPPGPNVCFVDGSRSTLVEPFSGDNLKAMLTVNGGEKVVPAP